MNARQLPMAMLHDWVDLSSQGILNLRQILGRLNPVSHLKHLSYIIYFPFSMTLNKRHLACKGLKVLNTIAPISMSQR